ncbi:ATP-binding protein [Polaromonas sp.]|uniref:sensor histidine kinase n=1 Tax=Polaromonas sp. TaxID=1869339 RepID=UPI003262E10E
MLGRHEIDALQLWVASIALLVSLAFCLALVYVESNSRRASTLEMEANNRRLSHLVTQYASAAFQLVDQTLKQGRSEWMAQSRLGDYRDFHEGSPALKALILQVAVVDASGMKVACSMNANVRQVDLGDGAKLLAHVSNSSDSLFVSRPVAGSALTPASIEFLRPIFRRNGSFSGVIMASVDTAFLGRFLGPALATPEVNFGLIGSDGMPRAWFGASSFNPALATPAMAPGQPGARMHGHFLTAATGLQPEVSWYVEPLGDFPLSVVVGTDLSALPRTAGWREMFMAALFLLGVNGSAVYGIRNLRLRNRAARQLQENQAKTISANEMKSRFVADISHELRTPLNGILGFSELVSRSSDMQKSIAYGKMINSSARHLHQLVNTMLDLAKIEAGRMEIGVTPCDLCEVCESVRGIHRHAAASKKLTLRVDYAPGLPKTIHTDRIKLMQILNNVLHNAVKFTAQGGVVLQVTQNQSTDCWLFRVSDSGPGMSPGQLEHVFERFGHSGFGADTGVPERGSGLGMALSRELVELLGGRIYVASSFGAGTTVEIQLPANTGVGDDAAH